MALNKTIARDKVSKTKKFKNRMTVTLLTNKTGTYRDLLIIGALQHSYFFKGKSAEQLRFYYCFNKTK